MLGGNVDGMTVFDCPTNAGHCTYPTLDLYHSAKSHDHNVSP